MMKKGMIRFLATGMTALTLFGAAAAFASAKQVYAAEVETISDTSESNREIKIVSVMDVEAYIHNLVGYTNPCQEYDNTKIYRLGNQTYSITKFDTEPQDFRKDFYVDEKDDYDDDDEAYNQAEAYLDNCIKKGMIDGDIVVSTIKNEYNEVIPVCYSVVGKMPSVKLSISTYTTKPVETIKITANKTMIRPYECACLQFQVNDGADEAAVTWRAVGTDGIADFSADGNQAFVTGFETGTVMVVAETEDGVRDFVQINIVDF